MEGRKGRLGVFDTALGVEYGARAEVPKLCYILESPRGL